MSDVKRSKFRPPTGGIPGVSAKPYGINRLDGLKNTRASISRKFPRHPDPIPANAFTTDFSHGDSSHLILIKRLTPSPLPTKLTNLASPCHPQTMPSHDVPRGHPSRMREAQSNQSLPGSFRRPRRRLRATGAPRRPSHSASGFAEFPCHVAGEPDRAHRRSGGSSRNQPTCQNTG